MHDVRSLVIERRKMLPKIQAANVFQDQRHVFDEEGSGMFPISLQHRLNALAANRAVEIRCPSEHDPSHDQRKAARQSRHRYG